MCETIFLPYLPAFLYLFKTYNASLPYSFTFFCYYVIIEMVMSHPKDEDCSRDKILIQSVLRVRGAFAVTPSKKNKQFLFISFTNICKLNFILDAVHHYLQRSESIIYLLTVIQVSSKLALIIYLMPGGEFLTSFRHQ